VSETAKGGNEAASGEGAKSKQDISGTNRRWGGNCHQNEGRLKGEKENRDREQNPQPTNQPQVDPGGMKGNKVKDSGKEKKTGGLEARGNGGAKKKNQNNQSTRPEAGAKTAWVG